MIDMILKYTFIQYLKGLKFGTYSKSGRNFTGKICTFHRGGRNRNHIRLIDFDRKLNQSATVYKILIDSRRSSLIGLVFYESGVFSYILLTEGAQLSDIIFSGTYLPSKKLYLSGSSFYLNDFILFSIVSSIEIDVNFGASVSRAAGTGALIIDRNSKYTTIKLKSGWIMNLNNNCTAVLGFVSNSLHKMSLFRKAGNRRWLGRRPIVRGVAMNPCDHPHGGGEGKKSPPRAQVSPWGKLTKNSPTNRKKLHKINKKLFKKIR